MVVFVQWVANANLSIGICKLLLDKLIDALVDNEATGGSTALAGRADSTKKCAGEYKVDISTGRDNDCIVAAELEQTPAQAGSNCLTYLDAHASATGSTDERQPPVIGHHFSYAIVAIDNAGYPLLDLVGSQDLPQDILAGYAAERGFFAGFPDNYITADQGDHSIPAPHGYREIKGRDNTHDAQRMPLFKHTVARPFRLYGQSVQLAGEAYGEITDVNHFLHFSKAFLQALTHLIAHQTTQRILIFAKCFPVLAHNFSPLGSRHHAPMNEGSFCSGNDRLIFFRTRLADLSDQLSVDG